MAQLRDARQIALERTTIGSLANVALEALPGLTRAIVLAAEAVASFCANQPWAHCWLFSPRWGMYTARHSACPVQASSFKTR